MRFRSALTGLALLATGTLIGAASTQFASADAHRRRVLEA